MTSDYFFGIFLSTIILIRVFLFLKPISGPIVKGVRIHHYAYGLILVLIGYLIDNLTVYAIGFGFFVDELAYILIGGKNHEDNYSIPSILGTIFFIAIVFWFKDYLIFN